MYFVLVRFPPIRLARCKCWAALIPLPGFYCSSFVLISRGWFRLDCYNRGQCLLIPVSLLFFFCFFFCTNKRGGELLKDRLSGVKQSIFPLVCTPYAKCACMYACVRVVLYKYRIHTSTLPRIQNFNSMRKAFTSCFKRPLMITCFVLLLM